MGVRRTPGSVVRAAVGAVVVTAGLIATAAPAAAAPLWPGGPDISLPGLPPAPELPTLPGLPAPPSLPTVPQLPAPPQRGPANFATPAVNPSAGEVVGIAQPVILRFSAPIADRAVAERAIDVTTSAGDVPGRFFWFSDRQVRWRPDAFWPANTDVTVRAGDLTSRFTVGDAIVTTADDATKTITVTRNGAVVRTMPTSMGKPGHETPNGTYVIGERYRDMYMDSSTYGVPVDAPEGYRTYVEYATRMSNSGIFVHAAPWSVGSQGAENVSHGCLNVSTEDAKWFYETVQKGDPVIVQNTAGGVLSGYDGLGDWQL
ncbi:MULTISPECIES: L,D-transpeptidase [Nocardiaceae]|uniref:L,D-transpeptidase family protein n=1 Tax=Rhodococcoides kroppenstedtii TaxID=293050 RepID=A0ABS7NSW4_9NOCA|nr:MULTISPECIES: L,D-transpeptidase [Rhodococcus]AMY21289.1 L,D-transpeptidase 2 [Rhodococcus sp. PBTS 1]MBY6312893.1 L,D-transpeptidase family protein [Rhodococcus kroppenstedtii]MBY6321103.1 L,D-transpeptidase family protein [Rhodococcus kroppenstedtii]MBY6399650.1 L,D-transpeptidase family protein [Rhodococcus kroppenstedtii]